MEINELIIGAWVLNGGIPAQVTGITCDGILETTAYRCTNIERVEPIPTTPENLEKNGFHFGYTSDEEDFAASVSGHLDPDSKGWVWDEGAGAIKVQFPTESDGGQVSIYGVSYLTMVFEVLYVHQFQHLINLCGIDKEITI